jgi:hypothetical protein
VGSNTAWHLRMPPFIDSEGVTFFTGHQHSDLSFDGNGRVNIWSMSRYRRVGPGTCTARLVVRTWFSKFDIKRPRVSPCFQSGFSGQDIIGQKLSTPTFFDVVAARSTRI